MFMSTLYLCWVCSFFCLACMICRKGIVLTATASDFYFFLLLYVPDIGNINWWATKKWTQLWQALSKSWSLWNLDHNGNSFEGHSLPEIDTKRAIKMSSMLKYQTSIQKFVQFPFLHGDVGHMVTIGGTNMQLLPEITRRSIVWLNSLVSIITSNVIQECVVTALVL